MRLVDAVRRLLQNTASTAQSLREAVAGIANQTDLLNRKFAEIARGLDHQSDLLNRKFDELVIGLDHQSDLLNRKLDRLIEAVSGRPGQADSMSATSPRAIQGPPGLSVDAAERRREAMERMPLILAERTFNTSHPEYDARAVRNFPGRLFNSDGHCDNAAFRALLCLATGNEVEDQAWRPVLDETLEELRSIPHAAETFERQRCVEQYLHRLGTKYQAHYAPGWVNLDDALFLYWLVRQVRPRTIVQTGVCNGLSSAFMVLALAKNGGEGSLYAIDLPPVFDPADPGWTVAGEVYGVVIPEGRTSGWLVPDPYRDRFQVWTGDAKELLPTLVDKVAAIDFFYHDSDHTYNHMMFEFRQARRKLAAGGLVVADDISWNSSLWDFADEHQLPAYNFKGAVGVAFC
jgi:predicted O-methyltransferase YrrM